LRPNLAFGPIDSITQYLLYLSVVAIGILVPLAIQKYLQRRKERSMVDFASANLTTELRDNFETLSKAHHTFERLQQKLADEVAWYEATWDSIQAGERPSGQPPLEVSPIKYPIARTTAWEMAKLSNTLPLIPSKRLLSLSAAYRSLALYNDRREIFIQLNIQSNSIDARFDVSNCSAVERRMEILLIQQASAKYQLSVSEGAILCVKAAVDA